MDDHWCLKPGKIHGQNNIFFGKKLNKDSLPNFLENYYPSVGKQVSKQIGSDRPCSVYSQSVF